MVFNIACGSPVIYDIFFHAHSISQNIKHSNHMKNDIEKSKMNRTTISKLWTRNPTVLTLEVPRLPLKFKKRAFSLQKWVVNGIIY